MKEFFSNLLFSNKDAEEMFTSAATVAAEAVAAETAEPQIEAGDSSDLDKFFGEIAEEQAAADTEAEAAREAERARLIRQYANAFKERILKEIQNKDWDRLVRAFERSTEEEDPLIEEVANLYNNRIAKSLPPQWWEKRAPELRDALEGDQGCFEILLTVIRSEVSQKANVRRQAASSNLLKQVKVAAEELGLAESEFPHVALSAEATKAAAIEIGQKCITLAVARAIRKNLLALRDQRIRIPAAAERAFFIVTDSRSQKWGAVLMALIRLVKGWQALESELCSRPGAPVKKLKERFFTLALEERAIQVAGHCHLDVEQEIAQILASAGNNKD